MTQRDRRGAGEPESPKLPHVVFVSYSSKDQSIANAVCAALEAENISCWIAPRDVQGGLPYSGQIAQAIREAHILLLILTGASNRSKHVLREVERAAHCQNRLLTFRVESIAPCDDLAYFLGADQWVDGFSPLPPSQHFHVLIQHTRKLLQRADAEQRPEEQLDAAPETFAHFRILRNADGSLFKLGKGGMGVTYKAIDTILNRLVALKVIAAEQLNSPQARHRFLREAQAAALIHHPHVATIFQFGEEGDAYFYAMEFVEGEDLERYVARRGPLSPASTLRVALQVGQALEAARARQLIHRDIKPANIMAVANRAGTLDVKLIDFGLAKGAGASTLDASRLTRTQDFVGSPAFASPEQCEMKNLDARSDIYSLGITLWYLLTGKRPFSGTVGEVMIAQAVKPPPFDHLAQTPEPVVSLIRRMLEKKPEDRFQTPEELQDATEHAAKQLSEHFNSVPERISPLPAHSQDGPSSGKELSEPVSLRPVDSQLLDAYLAVESGQLLNNRYRLVAEEREGNGGRLFHARDEMTPPTQSSAVAIKLLHPGIAADSALLDLIENELGVISQAVHPHLVCYYRLERGASPPCLVREWVHGFLLYDLLRWRRSIKASELVTLLEPLAATLDFVAGQGLGLVDISVRKLLLAWPENLREFEAPAKADALEWSECTLKLNPLSLAPLLFRSKNGWDRQTIVPASRVLSMTQAQAGIRGTKAVRLYGRLIYELLSGHGSGRDAFQAYTPIPELGEAGNETLRRACLAKGSGPDFRNCQEFWKALKENVAVVDWRAGLPFSPPVPPAQSPFPRPQCTPPPPKRRMMLWTILGGALIVCLAILSAIRFGGLSPSPGISPSPTIAGVTPPSTPIASVANQSPSPSVTVTLTPSPTPVPTLGVAPRIAATPRVASNVVFVPVTISRVHSGDQVWCPKQHRVNPSPENADDFELFGRVLTVEEWGVDYRRVYIFRPDTTVKNFTFQDFFGSGNYFLRTPNN
jgi:serine/threonine protein kinase